jgi:hypothetical protein
MNKQEVIDLMKSSKSNKDWNTNCDIVKLENGGGYPNYWYAEVILSGLCDATLGAGSSTIKFS